MSAKLCMDCGVALTAWNHSFGSARCSDCVRVPLARSKAFFERTKASQTDIQNYPVSKITAKLAGYSVFYLLAIVLFSMAGYGNSGSMGGLVYGVVGGLLAGMICRWLVSSGSVHPLDTKRWYNYALVYYVLVISVWAMAYMGLMPTYLAGSLFSSHVRLTASYSMPAFTLVVPISLAAAILGAVLGYLNILRLDQKNKTNTLSHFQRWQQANP